VFVKNLDDCIEFLANGGCKIRELLPPDNDHLALPYSIAIAKIEKTNGAIYTSWNSMKFISF